MSDQPGYYDIDIDYQNAQDEPFTGTLEYRESTITAPMKAWHENKQLAGY